MQRRRSETKAGKKLLSLDDEAMVYEGLNRVPEEIGCRLAFCAES